MKEPTVESGESGTATGGNGAADPLESVTAERDRLLEEKNELVELLRRRRGGVRQFSRRKRAEQEEVGSAGFAISDSVRAILPVLDDFERALKTSTADKEYARGMDLIYQRFADALKKLGLENDYNERAEVRSPHSPRSRYGGDWRRRGTDHSGRVSARVQFSRTPPAAGHGEGCGN